MDTAEHQDSWTGRTVSHYRLLEELGRGGMGVVYRAQDLLLERFVALKFLLADRRDEIRRQRLLQEARAASSLDHPNVCTIHEAAEDDEGNLFIAMRLCEGETLRSKIARGFVDLDTTLSWVSQAAAGLAHAHAHGIVHRDIKPANLALTSGGQIKIVDFGIALQPDVTRLTRDGAVVGTVAYMSPEQLQGFPVDHRTDLWALGIVLFELLTGRLPFGFAASPSYPGAVLSRNPEPVTKLRAGLPAGIEPLLDRLLAKDPAHRYQSAPELIRELEALREGFQGTENRIPTISMASAGPARAKLPGPAVNPRIAEVSVGRQDELATLARHLLPEPAEAVPATVCAIQGMPGVGKSFLADLFAQDQAGSFPGGAFRIILDPKSPPSPETLLDELADRLEIQGGDDLAERVRRRLRRPRALIHVENVDSPGAEVAAGRFLHQLPGSTVIVTGRLMDLGRASGWHPIRLAPFDEGTALRQLWGELGWEPAVTEKDDYHELVQVLGCLPLALHLAAGHLRSGRSVPGFLRVLRQRRFALKPADQIELAVGAFEETRKVLATSFLLSLELLAEELGSEADRLIGGLRALGHGPLGGFGRSLGAAIAGLQDDDFEELVFHAQKLGILFPLSREERPDGAWRLHPLLGEFLHFDTDSSVIIDRMTEWFLIRFPESQPGQSDDQGRRWREIGLESAALTYWLPRTPASDRPRVQAAATWYARRNGPFHLWIQFCETALQDLTEPKLRHEFLWAISLLALHHGAFDKALRSAQEMLDLNSRLGDEREMGVSLALIGDALQARGELEEAIFVWRERALPLYEKCGDTKEYAIMLCKVAHVLRLQERFEEALKILHEEVLPAFEALQDIRSRAVALGILADILHAQGDLDSALRIRQVEELPTYEMLGEPRSTAVTIGKIAMILHAKGEPEQALQILQQREKPLITALGDPRQIAICLGRIAEVLSGLGRTQEAILTRQSEQIPLLERLGLPYELVFAQESLALLILERQEPGDREEAGELLRRALTSAARLKLPMADRIRSLLMEHGFSSSLY